jgi:hypothetical protein
MKLELRASALGYGPCRGRWWALHRRRELLEAGYVLRPRRLHIAAPLGSGVHAGDAYLHQALAETGEAGGQERRQRALSVAVEAFEDRLLEATGFDLIVDQSTPSTREAVVTMARMVDHLHARLDPMLEPVLIERTLRVELASGSSLQATPDKFLLRQPDGGGRLADLKTGRFAPTNAAEQLGAQSLLVRAHYGTSAVSLLQVESIKRQLAKAVKPVVATALEQGAAERLALGAVAAIERDAELWEATHDSDVLTKFPSDFLCSERFCPAYGVRDGRAFCHAWRLKEGATE